MESDRAAPSAPGTGTASGSARGPWPAALVGAAFLIQLSVLLVFTLQHAVNVLFWDQWDFYTPLFERASLWRIFDWQHGPVRQGLGSVAAWMLAGLTHWSSRAEALAAVGIVGAAALLALHLKRRLLGPIGFLDAVIPVLFLSRAQYEVLVGPTNLSHGPLPLLLTMLICLAWTHPRRAIRYALVLGLNFLMIFTTFGLLMGLITPALLAIDGYRAVRARQRRAAAGTILALGAALLSLVVFFAGYAWSPAAACSGRPCGSLWDYPWFAGLMYANAFGFKAYALLGSSIVGIAVLACVVGVLTRHLRLTWSADADASRTSRALVILLTYSLLFCLATAIGRAALGLQAADGSRYYLYVAIGVFGLYLHLLTLRPTAIRGVGLALAGLGTLVAGFYLTPLDEGAVSRLSSGKRRWAGCYLKTGDVEGCEATAVFKIYPDPAATGLREKLDFLKRNGLNLYAEDP
jgi:hypothetical protein